MCVAVADVHDARLFLWNKSSCAKGRDAQSVTGLRFRESWFGALVWALLAAVVIGVLPESMWPYKLSKMDMLQLYVMFLPVGALALSSLAL